MWEQCGGEGGNCKQAGACADAPFPGKACPAGASCQKQNNWYYQCLPATAATAATASPASAGNPKLYDQCGGEGGNCKQAGACVNGPFPGKACPAGASCLKQSNWYFQCLPTEGYTCIPTIGNARGSGAKYTLNWWDQCGGMGGSCGGYQCMDGAYPNYACPSGARHIALLLLSGHANSRVWLSRLASAA
jgi:hypothetical protein